MITDVFDENLIHIFCPFCIFVELLIFIQLRLRLGKFGAFIPISSTFRLLAYHLVCMVKYFTYMSIKMSVQICLRSF